jgi:hypothetical protein
MLPLSRTPRSRQELVWDLGLSDREHFRKAYLLSGPESGLLERTIPDKPQSSMQLYRLTAKGHEWAHPPSTRKQTAQHSAPSQMYG